MKQTELNQWQSGMNLDTNVIAKDNKTLSSALNATLITMNGNEFILQNDMGNGRVETAYLPQGYVPVGMVSHGGIVYVASHNPLTKCSQIGCFPSPERNISSDETGAPTLVLNDFGVSQNATKGLIRASNSSLCISNTCQKLKLTSEPIRPGDTYSVDFVDSDILARLADFVRFGHYTINFSVINEQGEIYNIDSSNECYQYYYVPYQNDDETVDWTDLTLVESSEITTDMELWKDFVQLPILLGQEKQRQFNVYHGNVTGDLYLVLELVVPKNQNYTTSSNIITINNNEYNSLKVIPTTYFLCNYRNKINIMSDDMISYQILAKINKIVKYNPIVIVNLKKECTYTIGTSNNFLSKNAKLNVDAIQWDEPYISKNDYEWTRWGTLYYDKPLSVMLTVKYTYSSISNYNINLSPDEVKLVNVYDENINYYDSIIGNEDTPITSNSFQQNQITYKETTQIRFSKTYFAQTTSRSITTYDNTKNIPDSAIPSRDVYILTYNEFCDVFENFKYSDVSKNWIDSGKTWLAFPQYYKINNSITYDGLNETQFYYNGEILARRPLIEGNLWDYIYKFDFEIDGDLDNCLIKVGDNYQNISTVNKNEYSNVFTAKGVPELAFPVNSKGIVHFKIVPCWQHLLNNITDNNDRQIGFLTKNTLDLYFDLSLLNSNTYDIYSVSSYVNSADKELELEISGISYLKDGYRISNIELQFYDIIQTGTCDSNKNIKLKDIQINNICKDVIGQPHPYFYKVTCQDRSSYNNFLEIIDVYQPENDDLCVSFNNTNLINSSIVLNSESAWGVSTFKCIRIDKALVDNRLYYLQVTYTIENNSRTDIKTESILISPLIVVASNYNNVSPIQLQWDDSNLKREVTKVPKAGLYKDDYTAWTPLTEAKSPSEISNLKFGGETGRYTFTGTLETIPAPIVGKFTSFDDLDKYTLKATDSEGNNIVLEENVGVGFFNKESWKNIYQNFYPEFDYTTTKQTVNCPIWKPISQFIGNVLSERELSRMRTSIVPGADESVRFAELCPSNTYFALQIVDMTDTKWLYSCSGIVDYDHTWLKSGSGNSNVITWNTDTKTKTPNTIQKIQEAIDENNFKGFFYFDGPRIIMREREWEKHRQCHVFMACTTASGSWVILANSNNKTTHRSDSITNSPPWADENCITSGALHGMENIAIAQGSTTYFNVQAWNTYYNNTEDYKKTCAKYAYYLPLEDGLYVRILARRQPIFVDQTTWSGNMSNPDKKGILTVSPLYPNFYWDNGYDFFTSVYVNDDSTTDVQIDVSKIVNYDARTCQFTEYNSGKLSSDKAKYYYAGFEIIDDVFSGKIGQYIQKPNDYTRNDKTTLSIDFTNIYDYSLYTGDVKEFELVRRLPPKWYAAQSNVEMRFYQVSNSQTSSIADIGDESIDSGCIPTEESYKNNKLTDNMWSNDDMSGRPYLGGRDDSLSNDNSIEWVTINGTKYQKVEKKYHPSDFMTYNGKHLKNWKLVDGVAMPIEKDIHYSMPMAYAKGSDSTTELNPVKVLYRDVWSETYE